MHITATEERCKFCTLVLENKRLRAEVEGLRRDLRDAENEAAQR